MRLTDGRGADLVVDPIGGRTLEGSIACAAYRGRIGWMGNAGGATTPPNIWPLMEKNGTVTTIFFAMEQSRQPGHTYAVVSRAIERLGRGELRAVVDRLFALSDAADAPLRRDRPGIRQGGDGPRPRCVFNPPRPGRALNKHAC